MLGKWSPRAVLIVGGVAVLGAWYLSRKAGTALDITSDQNLAYRGSNAIGAALSGDENFNTGGFLYELDQKYSPEVLGEKTREWFTDDERWWN